MADNKQVRRYLENITYGKNSLASEIHGRGVQEQVNKNVASCVRNYDNAIASGDKELAAKFKSQIEKWHIELERIKVIKEEWAMGVGGGKSGEGLFSNYTNLSFPNQFFTENGTLVLDDKLNFVLGTVDGEGKKVFKRPEEITEDWVFKGVEESEFMRLQQSAVKQRNNMGEPLDFDVDWEVSKILEKSDAWKVMASDKIGGRYFLNDYVIENQEAIKSGAIPDNMLHPDSFDPDFDNRLHHHYATIIRKSFDPNYQTPAEARKADELIARTNTQDNTENTQA